MKKIVSVAVASMALFFFSFTSSMADGWTAGVAVTHGLYEATGQENEDTEIISIDSLIIDVIKKYNNKKIKTNFDRNIKIHLQHSNIYIN